jgi:hypothetical protein
MASEDPDADGGFATGLMTVIGPVIDTVDASAQQVYASQVRSSDSRNVWPHDIPAQKSNF